ncbi:hypothetical protein [Neisseria zalophi]|uniref:hypothetical protein n=1 Tax=Neisseria zalophi TaxID=640030 RepID=UPI001785B239|nr:hypothetical protein [Neisseria zalophi]
MNTKLQAKLKYCPLSRAVFHKSKSGTPVFFKSRSRDSKLMGLAAIPKVSIPLFQTA